MASRASSASDGDFVGPPQKANTNNQPTESKINSSDRAYGSEKQGHNQKHGALSRSPSPYRRTRRDSRSPSPFRHNRNISRSPSPYRHKSSYTRSPSPYRHKRHDSRSPSPYRHPRVAPRSPSPYRHSRGNRDNVGPPVRSQPKRRGSSPRSDWPDKRHRTDRNRYDRPSRSQYHDVLAVLKSRPNDPDARFRHGSHRAHNDYSRESDFRNGMKGQNGRQQYHHGNGKQQPQHARAERLERVSDAPSTVAVPKSDSKGVEITPEEEEPEEKHSPKETREEKRRRWAAIRAAAEKEKPKENLLQQALLAKASEGTTPGAPSPAAQTESSVSPSASPQLGHLDSAPESPDVMAVDKQGGGHMISSPTADSPSAADYDPIRDMLDDRDRAAKKAQQSELSADAYSETNPQLLSTLPAEKIDLAKKQKKDFDMFDFDSEGESEDEDVADKPTGVVYDEKMMDNWDDSEGYYKIIRNELVHHEHYRIINQVGKGVFATVAQAEDMKVPPNEDGSRNLVAIKIIRRNDLMRAASLKEMNFVRKVNEADPLDRRYIVRLIDTFDHKGHLCGIFEHMSKNLRDLLKEGNSNGITLQAIRVYARQMFVGLWHLQSCQIVHCDLKPDNILVSHDRKTIKLCDFGTAVDKRDIMDRTEYLVSRFYRAPEIILGMEIGYGIDMWAIGCTLYELWTGKILFTGRSNNQMIKAFMDCLGWPTEKLLKKGILQNIIEHFEAGPPLTFISREVDKHGIASVRRIEQPRKIVRDLKMRIGDAAADCGPGGPTATELNDFTDLLGACLNMNVEKRIQPINALMHKFFPQQKVAPKKSFAKPSMVRHTGLPRATFKK
ncbi:kinase-like protein [Massarina eburnea CBS 473.64]|uniref:Kinase-like protein n=1 Tax=Massarina eburnea CBS 473.64 TaxID=1395130 RepID=A0A6A6SBF0_9PLEO|nr:kinase-like protein [Massarina eburnea CBS 473.64]